MHIKEDELYPHELSFITDENNGHRIIEKRLNEENDDHIEYEKFQYSFGMKLITLVHYIDHKTSDLDDEYESTGKFVNERTERLSGVARLERHDGKFNTISCFGADNRTSKIDVEIRKKYDGLKADGFVFSGYRETRGIDDNSDEAFFMNLFLAEDRFAEVTELLAASEIGEVIISVDGSQVYGLYHERHYFDDDPERYKFLNNVKKVVNHSEMPAALTKAHERGLSEIDITIVKKTRLGPRKALDKNNTDSDVGKSPDNGNSNFLEVTNHETIISPEQNSLFKNNSEITKWLSRLVFSIWIIGILILIFK